MFMSEQSTQLASEPDQHKVPEPQSLVVNEIFNLLMTILNQNVGPNAESWDCRNTKTAQMTLNIKPYRFSVINGPYVPGRN